MFRLFDGLPRQHQFTPVAVNEFRSTLRATEESHCVVALGCRRSLSAIAMETTADNVNLSRSFWQQYYKNNTMYSSLMLLASNTIKSIINNQAHLQLFSQPIEPTTNISLTHSNHTTTAMCWRTLHTLACGHPGKQHKPTLCEAWQGQGGNVGNCHWCPALQTTESRDSDTLCTNCRRADNAKIAQGGSTDWTGVPNTQGQVRPM